MAQTTAPASAFMLETAPSAVITVHRRSSAQKRLDTIVEESSLSLLDAEVTSSFGIMGMSHWGASGSGQSLSSYQRYGSSYFVCAQ